MNSLARRALVLSCCLLIAGLVSSCGDSDDIGLTLGMSALTIHPGDQALPINVRLAPSSNSNPLTISVTGLPSGVTATPLTLWPGTAGVLYFSAALSADQEGFPATDIISDPRATTTAAVVASAGGRRASSTLRLTVSLSNPYFVPASIDLPVVTINTNGTPIIDGTTDVPGTITITSADATTSYLPNTSDSDNTAVFHLHGHTTAAMPKKPYHVKLTTSLDLLHTMGLNCPYITSSGKPICDKSKSYVLLANYDDKTFLRDWAASALANAIPIGQGYLNSTAASPSPSGSSTLMPWAPHSLFVELYLNGQYEGNYLLTEEIKVDSHRVNISELAESDVSDNITGGYLLEIDSEKNETINFVTNVGVPIGIVDPDFSPDPNVPEQTSYITDTVLTAEGDLYSTLFTDATVGWRSYFDEASVINFYIVNDVMGNVDGGAFYSSDYLYKDKNNPLLYMGPVWDFDPGAGNVNYQPIVNPTVPWMQTQAAWYIRWFQDPSFRTDLTTQWNALKNNGVLAAWVASITQEAGTLEQSQANNFGRWPMQGMLVWPNAEAFGNYYAEVAYLTNWVSLRIAYLDSQFNAKTATAVTLTAPASASISGAAGTLSAQVSGGSSPTGTVYFLASGVVVGAGALSGGTASLPVSVLPVGTDSVQAVYSGDNTNALSQSAAAAVIVSP